MLYQLPDIIRDVRVAIGLDPVSPIPPPDWPYQALDTDAAIISRIEETATALLLEVSPDRLDPGHSLLECDRFSYGGGKGWILLPPDFLRLLRFRMSDWRIPAGEPISPQSPLYPRQWSPWRGVSGNPDRPVVAIVNRPEGLVLEYFSCRDPAAVIAEALYVPRPRIDLCDAVELPSACYDELVRRLADQVGKSE